MTCKNRFSVSRLRARHGPPCGVRTDPADASDSPVRHRGVRPGPSGGGFRRGFLWAVLLFVILTLVYIFAPQIAGLTPALEAPMTAYVNMVNDLRILLQQTVLSFLQ